MNVAASNERLALEALSAFLATKDLEEFRPCAYYDKHLDCIRIVLRDCSVKEERKNRLFTILKANHATTDAAPGAVVGLTIKGVRHLFAQMGLDRRHCYQLADLLDSIAQKFPERTVREVVDVWAQLAKQQDLKVTVEGAAA